MLWITGSMIFLVWVVLFFGLHRGGFVPVILLTAITFFVTQFLQDSRTRAYKSTRGR